MCGATIWLYWGKCSLFGKACVIDKDFYSSDSPTTRALRDRGWICKKVSYV